MRRAVLMICDGLRSDMVTPELCPNLTALAARGRRFADHRSIFPSVTRASSASIATGCLPASHGLHGNRLAIPDGTELVLLESGRPEFRDRARELRGHVLARPTMAERTAPLGGAIVMGNVSPGATFLQDPDGFGYVHHRTEARGPGRVPLADSERLDIARDSEGDCAMTERFCEAVTRRRPALGILWLCQPDRAGHGAGIGAPDHLDAVAAADACAGRVMEMVDELRRGGDDVLMLVGSDHGQETVENVVVLDEILVGAGLKAGEWSSDVVVAPQGTGGLVYFGVDEPALADRIADFLESHESIGAIFRGAALAALGQGAAGHPAIAFTMRKHAGVNAYGVPGLSDAIVISADRAADKKGRASHGGLGDFEARPLLVGDGPGLPAATVRETRSSVIDIAPTILAHLGLPDDGVDGRSLLES